MSFSEDTKNEILLSRPKSKCCRRAMLCGMLFTGFKTESMLPGNDIEMLFAKLIAEFAKDATIGNAAENIDSAITCENCLWAYVRGAFLSCGTVTDPQKRYHLEFLIKGKEKSEVFAEFLGRLGRKPGIIKRRGENCGVYFKDSEEMFNLLTSIGAPKYAFKLLDAKLFRELRNDANRVSNCETSNIRKTVDAATEQMKAIEKIIASGREASLPESLKQTFDLRAAYPMATLEELAEMHIPPVTRSGVNHRLQRIIEFSKK